MLKLLSTLCFREALTLALTIIGRLGWALAIGVVLATLITSAARAQEARVTPDLLTGPSDRQLAAQHACSALFL